MKKVTRYIATIALVFLAVTVSAKVPEMINDEELGISSQEPMQNLVLESRFRYVGSALWSDMEALTVLGDYAYCAMAYGLMVLNISDVNNPTLVSRLYLNRNIYGIAVAGNYAYLTGEDLTVQVVDISNPSAPTALGQYPEYSGGGWGRDLQVVGTNVYACGGFGLRVIDVTDPQNPVEIGSYDPPSSSQGVAVVGNYAYVAAGAYGLYILDVSTPSAPSLVGVYDTPGFANAVAPYGHFAYVAEGSGLLIIDISVPSAPTLAGSYATTHPAMRVALMIGYTHISAYVSCGYGGLEIVDVTSPSNPSWVKSQDTPGYARGLDIWGDYICIADKYSMQVIDITPLAIVGSYGCQGFAQGLAVRSGLAYVADGYNGLQIIDLTDPADPDVAGGYVTAGYATDVDVEGQYAFVVSQSPEEVSVIDVLNPSSPTLIGGLALTGYGYTSGIDVSGDFAYIAGGSGGLAIVDISDPASPSLRGGIAIPGTAMRVAVRYPYAYVAAFNDALQIVNVSNPDAPVVISSYDTPGQAADVAVVGNYAYVADGYSGGLQIINISTPSSPFLAGSKSTYYAAYGVFVAGSLAYLANYAGMQIMDVANPSNPQVIAGTMIPSLGADIAADGGHVYLANVGFAIFTTFVCGDANGDGPINVADAVYIINYVFKGGPAPDPLEAGDANCDDAVNLADAVYLINYVFKGGPEPCCP